MNRKLIKFYFKFYFFKSNLNVFHWYFNGPDPPLPLRALEDGGLDWSGSTDELIIKVPSLHALEVESNFFLMY